MLQRASIFSSNPYRISRTPFLRLNVRLFRTSPYEQNVIYNVIYSNWQSLIKEENPYVIACIHNLRFFSQKSSIFSQEVAINSMLDQIEELKKIQNPEIIDDIHLQYLRLISVLFLPALKNGAAFGDKKPCKNHWNWNRSLSNSALVTRCWQ